MDVTSLLVFLAIGAVAGWLGSTIMKGGGFGLVGNIVVGILGAIVGGFLFGVQELATAVQYGIALVTLVFNNAAYGNVLRDQRTRYGNRVIGAALDNPDFMLLAKSFGIEGHRVATTAALAPVLRKARRTS